MIPAKIDNGMDADTITVLRQLPRNTRISTETRIEEMMASRITFCTAARTNTDWSKSSFSSSPCGAAAWISGNASRAASTTASVEASACLRMARYTARLPFTCTTLVCVAKLSLTCPTSPSVIGAPLNTPIGKALNRSTVLGLEFNWTL